MSQFIYAAALLSAGKNSIDPLLVVTGDSIAWVGEAQDPHAPAPGPDDTVTRLDGHILIPGLVNGHTHSAMTLLRGVSDDHGFMPWLAEVQALEQQLTHDDIAAGLQLAMLEMIESGTTSFNDMYVWDAQLLELVRDAGMRVVAALAITRPEQIMFPGVTTKTGRDELAHAVELQRRYEADPQIKIAYGPHAPYSVPREFFAETIEHAKRTGIPVHTHIAESPAETEMVVAETGKRPARYLRELGLYETSAMAAHCVHLDDEEIAEMAASGVALSHCPVSNLKLGNGVARLLDWLQSGVRISLGTDSVASNNTLDLFEELKLATILHRGVLHDAAAITAEQVFEIATRAGAEAIGFGDCGELAVGKKADIVALKTSEANAVPHANLLSHVVFAASGKDVDYVWIGGRAVYAAGEHLTLDAAAVKQRAAESAARIRAAAKL